MRVAIVNIGLFHQKYFDFVSKIWHLWSSVEEISKNKDIYLSRKSAAQVLQVNTHTHTHTHTHTESLTLSLPLQPSESSGFDPSLVLLSVLSHFERGRKPRHNDRRPDGGAPRGRTTHAGEAWHKNAHPNMNIIWICTAQLHTVRNRESHKKTFQDMKR